MRLIARRKHSISRCVPHPSTWVSSRLVSVIRIGSGSVSDHLSRVWCGSEGQARNNGSEAFLEAFSALLEIPVNFGSGEQQKRYV